MQAAPTVRIAPETPSFLEEDFSMTFVIALFNSHEIVVAADTLIYDTTHHKATKPYHKIMSIGPHLFAASGTSAAFDIRDYMDGLGFTCTGDISVDALNYYRKMNEVYQENRYGKDQTSSVLLAGFHEGQSQVYSWNLPSHVAPASNRTGYAFIGARENTATFFPIFLHRDDMKTGDRIQLAHFCATRVGESDPRVGDPRQGFPVDVAVLQNGGMKLYTEAELKPFVDKNNSIYTSIRQLFNSL